MLKRRVVLVGLSVLVQPASVFAERPRLETVWVDPVLGVAQDARGGSISQILFVNRCRGDCTLTPGVNDARANTSSLIDGTVTVSEFEHDDETFDKVVECLRDVYSPYGVEIVTEDPGGDVLHHEAILAGTPQELDYPRQIGGVAPAACQPLNNVISFSFANRPDSDVETMCWTLAQESAHSFGLPNHVYDCLDPMTYLDQNCGRKYFRNRYIQCGEFEPTSCICSVTSQNSHVGLLGTFGPGTAPAPPEVQLLYPDPDAAVIDNFSIFFTAIDPRLVDHVDIYLNGTRYASIPGYEYAKRLDDYSLVAPDHPDGVIDLELRAYNEINTEAGVATATVVKGEPCTSDDQCFDHMSCDGDGRCSYPPATGEFWDECAYDQFCADGPCVDKGGERRCTETCDLVGSQSSCPFGYECIDSGYCWAPSEGGCRAVAGRGDQPVSWALLSLFAGGLLLLRRRARLRN